MHKIESQSQCRCAAPVAGGKINALTQLFIQLKHRELHFYRSFTRVCDQVLEELSQKRLLIKSEISPILQTVQQRLICIN